LARDRSATFLIVRLRGKNHEATINAIDQILRGHSRRGFELEASGVPYVAEHIRRQLTRDLHRFSAGAIIAFALLITILFRSPAVLLGTMTASLTASFGTFLVHSLFGMETDILMPNLWTGAFVLTLSHVVYLTAEWRRTARDLGPHRATNESIRKIRPAALWSLTANLLGFSSLIIVSAKPLRQFGISGVIAAVLAIVCAFALYPPFLRAANPGSGDKGPSPVFFECSSRDLIELWPSRLSLSRPCWRHSRYA
jgi:predicted RND superfamily exporter protein